MEEYRPRSLHRLGQAQFSGGLGACMGTVGPGSIYLLNGLYDKKMSHAPVLAVCGHEPSPEIGTEMFQEVTTTSCSRMCCRTVLNAEHFPYMVEQAVNGALNYRGVAVLTMPGDVGGLETPDDLEIPRFLRQRPPSVPTRALLEQAADMIGDVKKVTMIVGCGARGGRDQVIALAEQLETCDVLLLVGTDFPYRDWYPTGKTVIQIDDNRRAHRPAHPRRPWTGWRCRGYLCGTFVLDR